ncbi:MAG: hypothetical protein ACO3QC_10460 [Phycisphaerales bacterium]
MNASLPAGTPLPRPFCAACGHDLTTATAASSCPGCGRPLVEVLTREPSVYGFQFPMRAKPVRRYESPQRVLGLPLVSVALGVDARGKPGHARGYIAIGDIATGVIALGGIARGVVAFGGLSLGAVTFGGLSLGALAAFGGFAFAAVGSAVGGFAVGLLAGGGGAIGGIAQGGFAAGYIARGAKAVGEHAWSAGARPDAETAAIFDRFAWLVGPAGNMPQIHYNLMWTAGVALVVLLLALAPVLAARRGANAIDEELRRTPGPRS